MRKLIPILIIVFVIVSYIGCKSTSNPVSPSSGASVKTTYIVSTTHDTVLFLAQPSVAMKINTVKLWLPNGDTQTIVNSVYTWTLSPDTLYPVVPYYYPTSGNIFRFDYSGIVASNNSAFTSTSIDTVNF